VPGTIADGAVVIMVSVVCAVPLATRVTVEGLKLQLLSVGSPLHIDDVSVALPLNPFCDVNISVVDPDCPGAGILIVVGLAVTVNAVFTVSLVLPTDMS
jgi:hypothetical protein